MPARVLLLADDPAADTDVPAWCALRGHGLAWTGIGPDGSPAFLVTDDPSAGAPPAPPTQATATGA